MPPVGQRAKYEDLPENKLLYTELLSLKFPSHSTEACSYFGIIKTKTARRAYIL